MAVNFNFGWYGGSATVVPIINCSRRGIFKFFLTKLCSQIAMLIPISAEFVFYFVRLLVCQKNNRARTLWLRGWRRIAEKSGLSKIYTCHSESIVQSVLKVAAYLKKRFTTTRDKNTSSLKHYISGMSTKQKEQCSSIQSSPVFDQPATIIANLPVSQLHRVVLPQVVLGGIIWPCCLLKRVLLVSQMEKWLLNIPNFSDRVLFKIANYSLISRCSACSYC